MEGQGLLLLRVPIRVRWMVPFKGSIRVQGSGGLGVLGGSEDLASD